MALIAQWKKWEKVASVLGYKNYSNWCAEKIHCRGVQAQKSVNTLKRCYMYVKGISEGKEKDSRPEKISEEITTFKILL